MSSRTQIVKLLNQPTKRKYFLTLSNQEHMIDTVEHENGHGNNIMKYEADADETNRVKQKQLSPGSILEQFQSFLRRLFMLY